MRMRIAWLPVVLLVVLTLTMPSSARADDAHKHVKVSRYDEGRAYCPPRGLVIGPLTIPGGRCYELAVVRDQRGAFLAFLDPKVRIPRGRPQRLDDEEGGRIRNHISFLVPLQMTGQLVLVPMNTIQLIRLQEEDDQGDQGDQGDHEGRRGQALGGRLIVFLPGAPAPSVTIVVTF